MLESPLHGSASPSHPGPISTSGGAHMNLWRGRGSTWESYVYQKSEVGRSSHMASPRKGKLEGKDIEGYSTRGQSHHEKGKEGGKNKADGSFQCIFWPVSSIKIGACPEKQSLVPYEPVIFWDSQLEVLEVKFITFNSTVPPWSAGVGIQDEALLCNFVSAGRRDASWGCHPCGSLVILPSKSQSNLMAVPRRLTTGYS